MPDDNERVKPAAEGDTFERNGFTETVGPKCNANTGAWRCITHDEGFTNNMQKDIHIERGKHVLVWVCFEHGPEVP